MMDGLMVRLHRVEEELDHIRRGMEELQRRELAKFRVGDIVRKEKRRFKIVGKEEGNLCFYCAPVDFLLPPNVAAMAFDPDIPRTIHAKFLELVEAEEQNVENSSCK